MINLRYHIVSLAAVFLAFGLGILAGTTVIDQGLVSSLRSNTRALEKDLNELRGNVSDLQKQLDVWENLGKAISQPLLQGKLAGRAVVIIEDDKIPGAVRSRLAEALRFSGAKRPTRLTLTDKWKLDSTGEIADLRRALDVTSLEPAAATAEAARRLGSRLAGSSDTREDGDTIRALSRAGFLDIADLDEGSFPAANAVVIVLSSGDPQEVPTNDDFLMPLMKAISATRIVAATEPTTADQSLAELVLGDRTLSRSVCTVDHIDTFAGRLSLVYGLRDLAVGRTAPHYGVRGGASAIAPSLG